MYWYKGQNKIYQLFFNAENNCFTMSRIDTNHWLVNQPIAHRGLHDGNKLIPENSLLAIKNAIHKGFAVEVDIVFTKDHEVIVFHDYDALRLCGVDKKIGDMTLKEIKTMNLVGTKEKVPTLQEVFDLVNNQVPVLVEIKNRGKVGHFENNINEILKSYSGDYAVQSFNPKSLRWFFHENPSVLRGHLASRCHLVKLPYYKRYISKNLLSVTLTRPDFVGYKIEDLPYRAVTKIRKRIPVLGWTINTNSKRDHARLYCDNFIFENITVTSKLEPVKEKAWINYR